MAKTPVRLLITDKTAADLAEAGVPVPSGVEITRRARPKDVILICASFDIHRGPIMADNVIGRCTKCRCVIQWRPHAEAHGTKLCESCGKAYIHAAIEKAHDRKAARQQRHRKPAVITPADPAKEPSTS